MNEILYEANAAEAAKQHSDLANFRSNALKVLPLEAAHPPSTNRGGPVDNFGPFTNQRTKLDWFGFTVVRELRDLEAWVQCIFPGSTVTPHPGGVKGYPESAGIYLNGAHLGSIGYGCKHGRNMVNITGEGCKRIPVQDYGFLIDATQCLDTDFAVGHELRVKDRVKLIRLDLAFDFFRGEVTWDDANQAFDEGMFDSVDACGQLVQPHKTIIDGSKGGKNLGRTLNVGLRSSAKMCRVYEKGLEVFGKMPDDYTTTVKSDQAVFGEEQFAVPGTSALDWLRVEVEFKPKDDLVLSWDMITNRDEYFSGAYKFCAFVTRVFSTRKPERIKSEAIVCLDKTIAALRNSYGNTIHTLRLLGLRAVDIVALLDSGNPNTKLMRAGVSDAVRDDPEWLADRIGKDIELPADTPF